MTTTTTTTTTYAIARCRAYTGRGLGTYRVSVDADGCVRVWDDSAGHYTTAHVLTRSAERLIARQVRASPDA